VPCPDQKAALEEFKAACHAPSTPTLGEATREPIRDAAAQICCLWDADDEDRQRVAEIICEYLPDAALPPIEATQRKYFCSCGMPCTAEEYIEHYFEQGHDRGEGAQVAVEAREIAERIVGSTFENTGASHETLRVTTIERITDYLHGQNIAAIISKHCPADAGEVERLKRAIKIRDSFLSGDEAAVGLIEIAGLLDRHFTGREGRAMTWREIIEHISDINREKEEARANAIRECVGKVAETRNHLAAARYTDSQRVVVDMFIHKLKPALESLAKEGDDGPTEAKGSWTLLLRRPDDAMV
jgi:hypothetical protein